MSPEQAAGLPVDARADVFSAAVVLAEMVSPREVGTDGSANDRRRLWAELREDPPRVPAGPWSAVLRRALSRSPEGRYSIRGCAGARARTRAAGDGSRRAEPLPGLLPFTREDARFFFGRELEVESLLAPVATPSPASRDWPVRRRQELVPAGRTVAGPSGGLVGAHVHTHGSTALHRSGPGPGAGAGRR